MENINSKEELKDIIANMDADVYIVRGDVETVVGWLETLDYVGFTTSDVKEIVKELQEDPYFKKLAEGITA